jgi:hypothetical protein
MNTLNASANTESKTGADTHQNKTGTDTQNSMNTSGEVTVHDSLRTALSSRKRPPRAGALQPEVGLQAAGSPEGSPGDGPQREAAGYAPRGLGASRSR